MNFNNLPKPTHEIENWSWEQFEPYYRELKSRKLTPDNLTTWLSDWSAIQKVLTETYNRLYTATTLDTTDEKANHLYQKYLDEFYPRYQSENQKLKEMLLESGLEPEGFEVPLQKMRAEAELFREENLPLLTEELKLSQEYERITGNQTVEWEGKEVTLMQLQPVFQETDRERREGAWRLAADRQLQDRQNLNALWKKLLEVRTKLAANAGLESFAAYRWKKLHRFDYTPEDCRRFHRAIEKVVVPAAKRLYEQRQRMMGIESVRPWDLEANPQGLPPLKPFDETEEFLLKAALIFHQVDPQLGNYFETMRVEGLLDVENRKGKAPGGYCIGYPATGKPFIFMNAVGIHDDVMTILHESGHAFHEFEIASMPYIQQQEMPTEMAEVASISMELLGFPYVEASKGGFYTPEETARARQEHLEGFLRFLPYMAVVDAFQLWVYENPSEAARPEACDATWGELWDRFMVGIDTTGLEDWKVTGWQRKLHIFTDPLYYVEYGIAQIGALQVWRNSLEDKQAATAAYRRGLALGGTRTLPDLFAAAGARFAFDEAMVEEMVSLVSEQLGVRDSEP